MNKLTEAVRSSTPGRFFLALRGMILVLILTDNIVEAVKSLHGFRLSRGNGVGVDVGCGAGLGMTQLLRYDYQRDTIGDHQGGVGVTEAMNGDLRHPRPGNKATEPLRNTVGEQWGSRVGGEYPPVLILPDVTHLLPLAILPRLVLQQHHNGRSGEKQRAGRGGRLGRADIDALPREIIGGLPDCDRVLVQVYVLPA